MPLVTTKNESIIKNNPTHVERIENVRDSIISASTVAVDLSWESRDNLLTHIEGSSWVVDYYSCVLTKDSDLSGLQVSTDRAFQQFIEVKNLEIKMDSPLSVSQDNSTKAMTAEGSGNIYPFITPNEGDMIIADIGNGLNAVFRITNTQKRSIFKQSCYGISFSIDSTDINKINNLKSKVVKTYYHQRDFLTYGKNPLLVKSEVDAIHRLKGLYQHICQYYLNTFMSKEYGTLMVPGQKFTTYDPFMTQFIKKVISNTDNYRIKDVTLLNVMDDQNYDSLCILDVLLKRDISMLNYIFTKAGITNTSYMSANPIHGSLRFSGFKWCIYPIKTNKTVDQIQWLNPNILLVDKLENYQDKPVKYVRVQGKPFTLPVETSDDSPYCFEQDADTEEFIEETPDSRYAFIKAFNLHLDKNNPPSLIKPVSNDYYIFSEDFYKRTGNICMFEELVLAYIDNKRVNPNQLSDLSQLFSLWGKLEQFYYLPIIMILIKASILGV